MPKAVFENKSDKDDYILDDYNEYYELYRHKESGDGIVVRLNKQKRNHD